MDNYFNNELTPAAEKQLRENKGWFHMLGIGLIALGTLAIVFSLTSTLITVMFIGLCMAIFGAFEAIKAFKMSQWSNFFLHLFLGLLYLVGGAFTAFNPTINALSLTMLLSIFFVVAGLLRVYFALTNKLPNRFAALLNGILTIVLGGLLWYQWPVSGLWAIGTLLGIDAIVTGWNWIMLSWNADKHITLDNEKFNSKPTV